MMDLKRSGDFEDVELAMGAMLTQLLEPLIDCPEQCSVSIVQGDESTTFVAEVSARDFERLAEGSARTAKSLKLLVSAVGQKSQRRFSLVFRNKSGSAQDDRALLPEIMKT